MQIPAEYKEKVLAMRVLSMQIPAEYAEKVLAMRDRGGRMSAQSNNNE